MSRLWYLKDVFLSLNVYELLLNAKELHTDSTEKTSSCRCDWTWPQVKKITFKIQMRYYFKSIECCPVLCDEGVPLRSLIYSCQREYFLSFILLITRTICD